MTPSRETIKAEREALGLTQEQAAVIVFSRRRSWQDWEGGQRPMHAGLWELFLIKTQKARRALAKNANEGEK